MFFSITRFGDASRLSPLPRATSVQRSPVHFRTTWVLRAPVHFYALFALTTVEHVRGGPRFVFALVVAFTVALWASLATADEVSKVHADEVSTVPVADTLLLERDGPCLAEDSLAEALTKSGYPELPADVRIHVTESEDLLQIAVTKKERVEELDPVRIGGETCGTLLAVTVAKLVFHLDLLMNRRDSTVVSKPSESDSAADSVSSQLDSAPQAKGLLGSIFGSKTRRYPLSASGEVGVLLGPFSSPLPLFRASIGLNLKRSWDIQIFFATTSPTVHTMRPSISSSKGAGGKCQKSPLSVHFVGIDASGGANLPDTSELTNCGGDGNTSDSTLQNGVGDAESQLFLGGFGICHHFLSSPAVLRACVGLEAGVLRTAFPTQGESGKEGVRHLPWFAPSVRAEARWPVNVWLGISTSFEFVVPVFSQFAPSGFGGASSVGISANLGPTILF